MLTSPTTGWCAACGTGRGERLNSLGRRSAFSSLGSPQAWSVGEGPAGGGEGPEVKARFWRRRLSGAELRVAHDQEPCLGDRGDGRIVDPAGAHRAPAD